MDYIVKTRWLVCQCRVVPASWKQSVWHKLAGARAGVSFRRRTKHSCLSMTNILSGESRSWPEQVWICQFRGIFQGDSISPKRFFQVNSSSSLNRLIDVMDAMNPWWGIWIPGHFINGGEPIHGGEPTYIVLRPRGTQPGLSPKLVGCLARPPCMCAPHHVSGLPTMYGFPTMYNVSKYSGIWFHGIHGID